MRVCSSKFCLHVEMLPRRASLAVSSASLLVSCRSLLLSSRHQSPFSFFYLSFPCCCVVWLIFVGTSIATLPPVLTWKLHEHLNSSQQISVIKLLLYLLASFTTLSPWMTLCCLTNDWKFCSSISSSPAVANCSSVPSSSSELSLPGCFK